MDICGKHNEGDIMEENILIVLLFLIVIALFIYILIKRADKIVSPEKYKKSDEPKLEIKLDSNGNVMCPYCGSTQIQIVKRGYHWFWGLFGSDKNERVCVHCMRKF